MADAVGIPVAQQLTQQGSAVKMVVIGPTQVPATPINGYRLYKSSASSGAPWKFVGFTSAMEVSREVWLYDTNPAFGILSYYAATALNATAESAMTTPLSIAPRKT